MRVWSIWVCVALAAGCAGDSSSESNGEAAESSTATGGEGPTREQLEPVMPVMEDGADPERNGELPDEDAPPSLTVAPGTEPWGDDGHGEWVRAEAPLRFDVISPSGWPGRALDPVLHVGELRLVRYEHVTVQVLRFVLADRAAVTEGAPVALQWGEDAESRVDLGALALPAPTPAGTNGPGGAVVP